MATSSAAVLGRPLPASGAARAIRASVLVGAMVVAGTAAAGAVTLLGVEALLLPALVTGVGWAALYPRSFVLAMIAVTVIIEPAAIDFTRPLSQAWYIFPSGITETIPFTTTPIELMLFATAASLALRTRPRLEGWTRPTLLVWAVPLLLAAGIAYGVSQGGPPNFAYHEARGLVGGMAVFFITLRLRDTDPRTLVRLIIWATTALSVVVFVRYAVNVGPEQPVEYAYAHEDVLFQAVGAALSSIFVLRAPTVPAKGAYLAHTLFVLSATAVTGRRSGILVLMIMAVVLLAFLFTKRPVLAIGLATAGALTAAAYLGAFWDQGYGALAQPARAIRSQVAPNERDASSNTYREIERRNVTRTLEGAKAFGVGFGNPYTVYEELPELEFWELQYHTPHDNILWLWLKTGLVGVAVFLGLWITALSRCILAFRLAPRNAPMPVLPVLLAVVLLCYFAFNQVDIGLVALRPIFPLAAAMALALTLRVPGRDAPLAATQGARA